MTAMRIRSVEARWVRIPIEAARQHVSDFGRLRTFDAAILRIETDSGLVGWGEGKNAAGSAGEYGTLVHLLNHEFGPRLIGRDPGEITAIWEDLYNGSRAAQGGGGGARDARDGAARAERGGDQRHRHRAVGHSGQGAGSAGLGAAGRAQGGPDAGLCLGRLGRCRRDRRRSCRATSRRAGSAR